MQYISHNFIAINYKLKFISVFREEVNNHCVVWKSRFNFQCKITANAQTGYLDPCMCRISVRRVSMCINTAINAQNMMLN